VVLDGRLEVLRVVENCSSWVMSTQTETRISRQVERVARTTRIGRVRALAATTPAWDGREQERGAVDLVLNRLEPLLRCVIVGETRDRDPRWDLARRRLDHIFHRSAGEQLALMCDLGPSRVRRPDDDIATKR
jgi:hypothetical protein